MKRQIIFLWLYQLLSAIGLAYVILFSSDECKAATHKIEIKTINCNSAKNIVHVSTRRVTDLSFLENPKEVVPGDASFDFKRIQNDVFIKALGPKSRTNVFIFTGQKRCRFELVASESEADDLLQVRESSENVMEVQFHDK